MANLIYRSTNADPGRVASSVKNLPLTNAEVDGNFKVVDDAIALLAPLASPTLTGTPAAPTATVGTNTTQLATTAFVNAEIANDAPTKTGGGASGTWAIDITGSAYALKSATTVVSVSAATAPTTGQILTATSGTVATWQTPSAGGDMFLASTQSVTGAKTFDSSTLKLLATVNGGVTTFANANASATAYTITFPAATGTVLTSGTTVTVPQGGTGVATLTGIAKGNGTGAFSVATAGTDYIAPGTSTTYTAAQSFAASGILLKGSSTGYTTFTSANASATNYTLTFPAVTATVLTDAADVTVAQGGTGLSTLTANNVILGNGTGTPLFVAPSTTGNVLVSNGTTWVSQAPGASGATLTDDNTTNTTYYPGMAAVTTGAWTDARVSSTKLTFNPSTGTLGSTVFNSLSDERVKDNIRPIGYGLSAVLQLEGKKFEMKDGGQTSIGLIAQEVAKVIPEVVSVTNENTGILGVNYPVLVAVLIESIRELNTRIVALETK